MECIRRCSTFFLNRALLRLNPALIFRILRNKVLRVLGPLLYLLYTAEFEQLILRHGLHIHQYDDDRQVHTSVPSAMYR